MKRRLVPALLALSLVLAACGDDEENAPTTTQGGGSQTQTDAAAGDRITRNDANAQTTITVGSKNFTEQKILGEIYAAGLEAAGYTVKKQLDLGDSQTALKAMETKTIDAYPEYTGTALLSFFDVKAADIPKDPAQAFEETKSGFAELGMTAFPPTPFTSSNEVALTKEKAEELGVTNISDLAEHDQDLTLFGSPECRQRSDCLLGLQEVYGLKFKKFTPVDIALRHEVLTTGRADVSIVFTTDPQIKREGFVLLKDDKQMFPPYNSTFVVRDEIAQQAGADLPATIDKLQKGLTAEAMQELNARVDLDKTDTATVAQEYLKESGLVE